MQKDLLTHKSRLHCRQALSLLAGQSQRPAIFTSIVRCVTAHLSLLVCFEPADEPLARPTELPVKSSRVAGVSSKQASQTPRLAGLAMRSNSVSSDFWQLQTRQNLPKQEHYHSSPNRSAKD
jgi:hypothetical protein